MPRNQRGWMHVPTRPLLWAAAVVALGAPLLAGMLLAPGLSPRASGQEKRPARDVSNMDLDLLKENMLKVWIVEEASDRYNQMRIAQKSFEALTPLRSTGDPELDELNIKERLELDKEIAHYLELELDGAIQVVDICRRVLGNQPKLDAKAAATRRFMSQDAPSIAWRGLSLERALQDLGRKLKIRVELTQLPDNVAAEIDLQVEGATVAQVLDMISSWHPMHYEYDDGVLLCRYIGTGGSDGE